MKKIKTGMARLLAAAFLLIGGALAVTPYDAGSVIETEAAPEDTKEKGTDGESSQAEVHFIDVGQGDATLIKCGEHAMLIDTGDNDKGMALQMYLKKQGVEKLDFLILTHPDADHIGGADVIITKFRIGKVFMADYEKENKTYKEVIQALADKRLKWTTPKTGAVYSLGDAEFTIMAPNGTYDDPNNSSIALLFRNGGNTFLFTGDAQEEAEQDILDAKLTVKADVYKAGHHGSDTSSSRDFLKAVKPKWAVISCGEGNAYGHPHASVLNNLRAMGVKVFRTDEQGSIVAQSDGKTITWNCAPSESWQVGERTGSAAKEQEKREAVSPKSGSQAGGALQTKGAYIGNKNNGKLHRSDCKKLPNKENRVIFDTKDDAVKAGYDDFCKLCKP